MPGANRPQATCKEDGVTDAILQQFDDHVATVNALRECASEIGSGASLCAEALKAGGKVLLCGNGGSAADAQHIAAELIGRFINDRRPLPAIALTTDTSALTAIGNDYGYADVFSRQVAGLAAPGDVLIAISTSGNSENVNRACEVARDKGCSVVALSGKGGGALNALVDVSIVVPSSTTARIQECHILIGHLFCGLIEDALELN